VGLLCYIIAEDRKTAKELFDSEKPLQKFLYDESLFIRDAQGFTAALLQPLCTVLAPGANLQVVQKSDDGKRTLLHLPDQAIAKLAELQNNQMKTIAEQWLQAMPAAYQGRLKQKDVENGVRFLCKVMTDAKPRKKPVFLYQSI
jgi:hypothetical protein